MSQFEKMPEEIPFATGVEEMEPPVEEKMMPAEEETAPAKEDMPIQEKKKEETPERRPDKPYSEMTEAERDFWTP